MRQKTLTNEIYNLIKDASSKLPHDVVDSLKKARNRETNESAKKRFDAILENIVLAKSEMLPICQDTGYLYFIVEGNYKHFKYNIEECIKAATKTATEDNLLRVNTIETQSAKQIESNVCENMPFVEYKINNERETLKISLLLKGGGSENVSKQFSVPSEDFNYERSVESAYYAAMSTVFQAQGKGCSPGVLGIAVGGDRALGYKKAKEALFTPLDYVNKDERIRKIEERIFRDANKLGIGVMGLSGDTTILKASILILPRIPASFFITVCYNCYLLRRSAVELHLI